MAYDLVIMKILTVVPTYNEIENIESFIIAVFQKLPPGAAVLVIDDSSPDGTALAVEKLMSAYQGALFLKKREGKLGQASAFLEGFSWGIEQGYEVLLAMDADFSHDPAYIPAMAAQIETHDLVIGSRNVKGGGVENRAFMRNFLTKGASLYCRVLLGCPLKDFTGGYNMWRAEALKRIDPESIQFRAYSFQIEMKYKAWKRGLRIIEIPIIFPDRRAGSSKMSTKYFFDALISVFKIRKMA
jgi:dolichol-phosphate mannosyltransferase